MLVLYCGPGHGTCALIGAVVLEHRNCSHNCIIGHWAVPNRISCLALHKCPALNLSRCSSQFQSSSVEWP